MKARLFLSYGRSDVAGLASRLRIDLEKPSYDVWQDTCEIRAGNEWEDQTADDLRRTQVVVALLSPDAVLLATDPNSPDKAALSGYERRPGRETRPERGFRSRPTRQSPRSCGKAIIPWAPMR